MSVSTTEQILTKLANVDSLGSLELALDTSIYSPSAVQRTVDALKSHPIASITTLSTNSIRITATDPRTARVAVGLALAYLIQFGVAGLVEQ